MTSVYLSHHTARHQRLCHTPISSQVNCSIKSDLFTMMELICGLISALLVWWPSRGPRACSPDDFLATVLYAQPSASTSIYHTQDLGYSQLSSVSSTVTMHMSVIIIHWSVVCVLADEIQQSYIYMYTHNWHPKVTICIHVTKSLEQWSGFIFVRLHPHARIKIFCSCYYYKIYT